MRCCRSEHLDRYASHEGFRCNLQKLEMASRGRRLSFDDKKFILEERRKGRSTVQIARSVEGHFGRSVTRRSVGLCIQRAAEGPKQRKLRARKLQDVHLQLLNVWISENAEVTLKNIKDRQ